jgi:hypothetical protein
MFWHWIQWQLDLTEIGVNDTTFGFALTSALILHGLLSNKSYEEVYPEYNL